VFLADPSQYIYPRPGTALENLGICYLGEALREAGIPTVLVDGAAQCLAADEVLHRLFRCQADFIGFSVTHATIREALHLSQLLKKQNPSLHICFGGHHATFSAQQILEDECSVDSVVRGEGEETIVELVRALRSGDSLEGVRGICFRDSNGVVRQTQDRLAIADLDVLPFPARDVLDYIISSYDTHMASISSSRGCLQRCGFCSTPEFYRFQTGPLWRSRTARNVVDEIQILNEKRGIDDFLFVDDNFVVGTRQSKERAYEICRGIIDRGLQIKIFVMCGANVFGPEDEELLRLMRVAGVTRIFLGVEAGYQPTLDAYNKPVTPEGNLRAVDLFEKHGFMLLCGTILFHPYAVVEELKKNSQFIYRLMNRRAVAMIAPYCRRLEAYPGLPITREMKENGLLSGDRAYLDAYAYRFVVPAVQVAADTMWNLLPDMVDTDWLIWEARLLLLRLTDEEKRVGSKVSVPVQSREGIEQHIQDINDMNYDFFNLVLELASQGATLALDKEKGSHILRLRAEQARLRREFEQLRREVAGLEIPGYTLRLEGIS
jgi:anaerobic magnesium-protoporphyrin IX monomethyl ester cyclase